MDIINCDVIKIVYTNLYIKLKCGEYLTVKYDGEYDIDNISTDDIVKYIIDRVKDVHIFYDSIQKVSEINIFGSGDTAWTLKRFITIPNPTEEQLALAKKIEYQYDNESLDKLIRDIV